MENISVLTSEQFDAHWSGSPQADAYKAGLELELDKIGALLSADPDLWPITCSRSGPHGEHLTLRLVVNGGGQ